MLGLLEAQPVLRHQIEHLELQHRIERRPPAPRAIARRERCVDNRPEQIEVDDLQQLLKRVALLGKLPQALVDTPKPGLPRQRLPPSSAARKVADHRPIGEVFSRFTLIRRC
jgi:hypothetical protein